jgi:hypothetical protein
MQSSFIIPRSSFTLPQGLKLCRLLHHGNISHPHNPARQDVPFPIKAAGTGRSRRTLSGTLRVNRDRERRPVQRRVPARRGRGG